MKIKRLPKQKMFGLYFLLVMNNKKVLGNKIRMIK